MKNLIGLLFTNMLVVNLVFAIIYVFVFRLVYVQYLYPTWGYMGYEFYSHSTMIAFITNALAIIPILFYKARKIPSDFIAIFVYIFIVVPSILSMEFGFENYSGVVSVQVVYSLSMIVFFHIKEPRGIIHRKKENFIKFKAYTIAVVVILICCIATYRLNMRFVSVEEVYDLREETADLQVNPIIGYFMMWLANFFSPLFVSYGLVNKNKNFLILGFTCALVVYMSSALKSAFITPILCIFIYLVIKKLQDNIMSLFPIIVVFFTVLYFVGMAIDNNLAYLALSLFIMRTFGISAMLTPGYISVFSSYPHTYFSHVRIVNSITGMYPFQEPVLGKAVWSAYTGETDAMNANANMLLTDGIASCGILGVIIVTIFFALILNYLNKVSMRHDKNFVLILLTGIIMSLSNVSLFTALLSCGLLLIMILLRFTSVNGIVRPTESV